MLIPPLAYQINALNQVVAHLRTDGHLNVTRAQLDRILRLGDRDGISPRHEPLTLAKIQLGLRQLAAEGVLRLEKDRVIVASA